RNRIARLVVNKGDGTIDSVTWDTNNTAGFSTGAYYPKIADDAVIYGHRGNDTVYCVDLADGNIRWSYAANGQLSSIEVCSVGVIVGSNGTGGEVTVLDYTTGAERTGWPVSVAQHEQLPISGELDGQEVIVLNDNDGNVYVYDLDGTLIDSLSSDMGHPDNMFIGDFGHGFNELLVVVDDDDSAAGVEPEGDEIAIYRLSGGTLTQHRKAV